MDCTYQPSVLLSFLQSQSHTGGEVIRGKEEQYSSLPKSESKTQILFSQMFRFYFKMDLIMTFIGNHSSRIVLKNPITVGSEWGERNKRQC